MLIDPEDADEDGQGEHDVEERDELVEVGVLAVDPLLAGLELGVGEPCDRLLHLRTVLIGRLARTFAQVQRLRGRSYSESNSSVDTFTLSSSG